MEIIKSKANQTIVLINKLKQKKYRDKLGLFFIESDKVVKEAILNGVEIDTLIVEEGRKDFLQQVKFDGKVLIIDKILSEYITDCVTPQGVFAMCKVKKQEKINITGNFLVMENLQDPDNVGACIRSAVASGFKDVFTINCADPFSSKAVRTSMANVFKANIYNIDYSKLQALSKDNILLCADMKGDNIFNIKLDCSKKYGVVVGNEGNGVTDKIQELCTKTVAIPMKNGVESLNASVSCAIIMYQISTIFDKNW